MKRSNRRTMAAKTGASSLFVLAVCVAGPASGAVASAAFYTPPTSLPASNGALIRTEPMTIGTSVSTPAGTATRIMYKSTDTNGEAVAVTGTYIEPKTPWTGAGRRPLVTFAEGTQGQGDSCAPSHGIESPLSGTVGGVNLAYDVPAIASLVGRGFAVVATDYVGLGTGDRLHTYVNRLDQGHAVLDAARAALQVSGASVTSNSPVGAYGYSQGGGAAASAAELQSSYAPDVNLKGVYAGAPPADLSAVMRTADGTTLTAVIGYAINGFLQTYPSLRPILDANTNAAGKAALKKISTQCIADSIFSYAFQKTSQWTASGKTVSQIVAENPAAQAVVDAQRIGTIKPRVPVEIVTGTRDDIVTHSQVKQLATDWCTLGANVNYVPVTQLVDSYGTSLNHLGPSFTEASQAQSWLAARLAGTPATSNCASVPTLP